MVSVAIDSKCDDNNIMLEAALNYVSKGWAVLPLAPGDKKPFSPLLPMVRGKRSWKSLAEKPATEQQVRDWFTRYPNINIGIITGEASKLIVVDFDTTEPKELPLTVMARTGRGLHVYLSAQHPYKSCKFDGGDIKAQGGYVVAPPSKHPSGSNYQWADFLSPQEADLEPYDDALIKRITGVSTISLSVISEARININTCFSSSKTKTNKSSNSNKVEHTTVTDNTAKTITVDSTMSGAQPFIKLQKQEDVAFAVMQRVGVQVKQVGKSFKCPLPGHEETKPSAALYRMNDGIIALKDFHKDNACWLLPDVYASFITGKTVKLEGASRIVWWLRCLDDLGYIKRPAMHAHKLPDDALISVKKLYDGLKYLLELRTLYNPEQVGAPFSWRFAQSWCDIGSPNTVEKAMKYLLERGYVYQVRGITSTKLTILALGKPRPIKQ